MWLTIDSKLWMRLNMDAGTNRSGIDRFVMLMADEPNIRESNCIPKNNAVAI